MNPTPSSPAPTAGGWQALRAAMLACVEFLPYIGPPIILALILGLFWVVERFQQPPKIEWNAEYLRGRTLVTLQDHYLELLKAHLIRLDFGESDPTAKFEGTDVPKTAETMIGLRRLDNLHLCISDVLHRQVPGDFIEAGAWRGGATIFMRAALLAYNERTRNVWVADSFQGLPKPDSGQFPADSFDVRWTHRELVVTLDEVKQNFANYGLLDQQVRFLPGWFKDTLPNAPIQQLAILRIDGDLYESTFEALTYLYPKVSIGGYVIVDDYGGIVPCRKAVDDFRATKRIREDLKRIDWTGVFWEKLH